MWLGLAFLDFGKMLLCSQVCVCVCVCVYYVVLCSFMVIIFRSLGWHYLIILVMLLLKMILQFSARNSQIFFML